MVAEKISNKWQLLYVDILSLLCEVLILEVLK